MNAIAKDSVDLLAVVESTGTELKRSGSRWTGLCPFHPDTRPSFIVYPDGRWRCFSCQIGGDCIDFVMLKYDLSFRDALKHLNIDQKPLTPQKRQEIKKLKHRRELVKAFREWETRASAEIGMLCRCCRKVLGQIEMEADLLSYGDRYHDLASYQYRLDVLIDHDDQAKLGLYNAGYY